MASRALAGSRESDPPIRRDYRRTPDLLETIDRWPPRHATAAHLVEGGTEEHRTSNSSVHLVEIATRARSRAPFADASLDEQTASVAVGAYERSDSSGEARAARTSSLRAALRRASRKPSGIRSPPSTARATNPFKARSERRVHVESRRSTTEGRGIETGLSVARTSTRPSPTFQAASGQDRRLCPEIRRKSNT